jgi:hypothetical protein
MYSAELGRFLTRDPVGYRGGVNLAEYAYDNPSNRRDPLGEQTLEDMIDYPEEWTPIGVSTGARLYMPLIMPNPWELPSVEVETVVCRYQCTLPLQRQFEIPADAVGPWGLVQYWHVRCDYEGGDQTCSLQRQPASDHCPSTITRTFGNPVKVFHGPYVTPWAFTCPGSIKREAYEVMRHACEDG